MVFRLGKEMASRGYAPTTEVYEIMIATCATVELGSSLEDVALGLFEEMKKESLVMSSSLLHNLLKILSQSPNDVAREAVLAQMRLQWIQLSEHGAQYVILGLLQSGQLERAEEVYDTMRVDGQRMQDTTYIELIKSLGRVKEVDEVFKVGKDFVEDRQDVEIRNTNRILWYELLRIASSNYHVCLLLPFHPFFSLISLCDVYNTNNVRLTCTKSSNLRLGYGRRLSSILRGLFTIRMMVFA